MHNILYHTYNENVSKSKIEKDICDYVRNSGDGYGTDRITFYDSTIYDNREKAEEYIRAIDNDFYGGYAVKFYDFSQVKDTPKIEVLKEKIAETIEKKKEFEISHSVKNQKATLIGCSGCGSKLNREKLRSEKCPLCYKDLRADSTLERLASFDNRVKGYREKIEMEQQKAKKKAEVKWLVKFEYHS